MEEFNELYETGWDEWRKFPDPRNGEYLYAPYGCGVYQLKNIQTGEFILFGKSTHLAQRMTTLLPTPYGAGTRNNLKKRNYVFENIKNIEYRTISFANEQQAKEFEGYIKSLNTHIFNT